MYTSQPCQKFLEVGKLFPRPRLLMAEHDWLEALFSGAWTLSRAGECVAVLVSRRHDDESEI